MPWHPLPAPGYDRKPEHNGILRINDHSPFAKGCTFDWVGGAGRWNDNAGGRRIRLVNNLPVSEHTKDGLVEHYSSGNAQFFLVEGGPIIESTKPWSLAIRAYSFGGAFNQVLQVETEAAEGLQGMFGEESQYGDFWLAGSVQPIRTGPNSAPTGQLNEVVATFRGGDPNTPQLYDFYINGMHFPALTGGSTSALPNRTLIGGTNNDRVFNGYIAAERIWDVCLDPPLALAHSRSHYAPLGQQVFIRADYPRFWFVPEEGADFGLVRVANENLQMPESEAPAMRLVRLPNETVNLVEGLIPARAISRESPEEVSLPEGRLASRTMIRRNFEGIDIGEALGRFRGISRSVVESLQIAELHAAATGISRAVIEALTIPETAGSVKGIVQLVDEALGISEAIVSVKRIVQEFVEGLQIPEARAAVSTLLRHTMESFEINESLAPVRAMVRFRAEAVSFIEAAATALTITRAPVESLQVAEESMIARGFSMIVNETISIAETAVTAIVEGVISVVCGFISLFAASNSSGISVKPSTDATPAAPSCEDER